MSSGRRSTWAAAFVGRRWLHYSKLARSYSSGRGRDYGQMHALRPALLRSSVSPLSSSRVVGMNPYPYPRPPLVGPFSSSIPSDFHRSRAPSGNPLIACAREKEYQLSRPSSLKNNQHQKSRLPADRWFESRFMSRNTYMSMCKEFRAMDSKMSAWETGTVNKEHTFLRMPVGGGNMRRIAVNGNFVGGGEFPNYVACEGPTSETVYDFWSLVWQEGINRIVSVNFPYEERLYEHSNYQRETTQYWPMQPGETVLYLPFKLICLESRAMVAPGVMAKNEEEMVYRITRVRMRHENNILEQEPDREITHLCYYRWPDGRVPIPWPLSGTLRSAAQGLTVIVEKELHPSSDAPMLVHCHAGIGRTGVIIAVDMALYQLRTWKTANIKHVVEELRLKRPRSVMNPWQYALVHLIVAEKALATGLVPEKMDGQETRGVLDRVWEDMETDIRSVFGEDLVTYRPELMRED